MNQHLTPPPTSPTSRPCRSLRQLVEGTEFGLIVEAHDGLSATLVEEAGFDAIWASSLAISSAWGVRDCSELTSTQILVSVEQIAEASRLPVLVDGESGHGDYNSVRRFVKKLGRCGAAGVCLEDKTFPRSNSLLDIQHHLAATKEFAGKIMAANDCKPGADFLVVARTEALICGRGMQEALQRAAAYVAAGADALVIHSRSPTVIELAEFVKLWSTKESRTVPVIAIPTTYPQVTSDELQALGVSAAIFPNQVLRAAIAGMRDTLARLRVARSLIAVEDKIATLSSLFSLLKYDELPIAKARYGGSDKI